MSPLAPCRIRALARAHGLAPRAVMGLLLRTADSACVGVPAAAQWRRAMATRAAALDAACRVLRTPVDSFAKGDVSAALDGLRHTPSQVR